MSTFLLGTNRFNGCDTLVTHQGSPVLKIDVEGDMLSLDLQLPKGATSLHIKGNVVTPGEAKLFSGRGMLSVIVDETLVLHAVQIDSDEVLVDLDFRPLGVAIHTDAAGLHIGKSVVAGNIVQGARVGIALS